MVSVSSPSLHWPGDRAGSLCSSFPLLDLSPSFSKISDFNLSSPDYTPHSHPALPSSTNPRVTPHSWVTWILVHCPSLYQHSYHSLSDFSMHTANPFKSRNSWFLGLLPAKVFYPISATHFHGHTQTLQLPITETPSTISFEHLSLQPWPNSCPSSSVPIVFYLHFSIPQGHSTNIFSALDPPQVHTILLTQLKFYL